MSLPTIFTKQYYSSLKVNYYSLNLFIDVYILPLTTSRHKVTPMTRTATPWQYFNSMLLLDAGSRSSERKNTVTS